MSEPGQPSSPDGASRGRGSAKVAAGIFLSRIAGLVRESLTARYFGVSATADAWKAALRLPNLLQNLLGEGTLSASFIPIYSELLGQKKEEEAARFAGAVFGLLAATVAVVVAIGVLIAPVLVAVIMNGWDSEQRAITVTLVRILFPMTGTLVLSAWALGVLNSHRRFALPYLAPLAWNAAMIGTLLLGGEVLGRSGEDLVRLLAWGGVLGGALQFLVQFPLALRLLGGLRLSISTRVTGVRDALGALVPALAGRGAVNLSGYVDTLLASYLAFGAVATLGYAQTLYLLPISLFGLSVAASELPELAREGRREGWRLRENVHRAVFRVLYFLIPSAVSFLLLGELMVEAIYRGGAFGESGVLLTSAILAAYSLGIPASGVSRLYSSTFYALRTVQIPAIAAYVRLVLSAFVGFLLMRPLDEVLVGSLRMGAVGLALAASAAAWGEFLFLSWQLRRLGAIGAGGPPEARDVSRDGEAAVEGGMGRKILAIAGSAVMAGAVGVGVSILFDSLHSWVRLAGVLLVFGGVYLGMTYSLHAAEPLRELLKRRRG